MMFMFACASSLLFFGRTWRRRTELQIYLMLDDRQTLGEKVSCRCYVTADVLISTTMNVGHFAGLPNVLDYVIVVVLNMQFPS